VPWVLIALAALAVGARTFARRVSDRMEWVPLAAAAELSQKTGRPLLYDFTADWCSPCKRLERDVFADARQAAWLSRQFVPVRVLDREREDGRNSDEVERLKEQMGVGAFPTLVVARPDGTVVARQEGYGGNPRQLAQALDQALGRARKR
jgi:thiol:disulfide interchange protein